MNTYAKFCPNVFVAKCHERHEKGEEILVETRYGQEHECIVYNLVAQKDGFYYYSIIRADGYNMQERAKAKAERYAAWAESAGNKSAAAYRSSREGADFLVRAEPIKIGHHSEKRHRALIDRNHDRMAKSISMQEKADKHQQKADYWASRENEINLSMPESIDFYEHKLEQAKAHHLDMKNNPEKRRHSYSLTYAKKAVNEAEKNLKLAIKLWGDDE